MPWLTRGLRNGIVTTRYPRRPDGYGPSHRSGVVVSVHGADPGQEGAALDGLCPTDAIITGAQGVRVDRGRCILCGRCVSARPDLFAFDPDNEVAVVERRSLVAGGEEPHPPGAEEQRARAALATRVRSLRRSVHVRHVDAGSDGSEEWEISALTNPAYDMQRLGIFFTASPRHADVLLVTGAGTAAMAGPLRRTWEAMPEPRVVIAAGTDAISGGIVAGTYSTSGGIAALLPVDVWVPGSPPSPFALLNGLLVAVGLLPPGGAR